MNTRLMNSALLSACLLVSGAAMAADAAVAAPQNLKTAQAMFSFADQNKDGRLTRAEAQGHLPITFTRFDRIDTARRGWISFEQFADFTNQRAGQQAEAVLKVGQWH